MRWVGEEAGDDLGGERGGGGAGDTLQPNGLSDHR